MSVTHYLVNGADRGDWSAVSKDTSGGSFEPRGRGASNGVLGARRRIEVRSGEPGEQRRRSYRRLDDCFEEPQMAPWCLLRRAACDLPPAGNGLQLYLVESQL